MEKLQISRSFYGSTIGRVHEKLEKKKQLIEQVRKLDDRLVSQQTQYVDLLEAQRILSAVSDENTTKTLDYISSMVNKVLLELFPEDPYYIKMTPKLYAGTKPHLIVELYDANSHLLDVSTQSGDGIKQVVSFMYVICLIEIRKGRRLLILDERLNGLHKRAKNCLSKIIEIFTKGGFQFIFVEYSLNDIGKIYNVERVNIPQTGQTISTVSYVDGEYTDDIIHLSEVDLSVLDESEVEE